MAEHNTGFGTSSANAKGYQTRDDALAMRNEVGSGSSSNGDSETSANAGGSVDGGSSDTGSAGTSVPTTGPDTVSGRTDSSGVPTGSNTGKGGESGSNEEVEELAVDWG